MVCMVLKWPDRLMIRLKLFMHHCRIQGGGVLWKCLYLVFKTGRSVQDIPLLLRHHAEDSREEEVDYREAHEQEDWSLQVCGIGPMWALTWLLNSVSATCWGGCTRQMPHTISEDRCHIQITSNGDTDDCHVHKCFSLGLSWLWVIPLDKCREWQFTSFSHD